MSGSDDAVAVPSNWGRWGDDDEMGTLNLITAEVRARAVGEARTGRTVALAKAVAPTPYLLGPAAQPTSGPTALQQAMLFTGSPPLGIGELWTLTPHHPALTHLDALSHIPVDGMVYPGRPLAERVGPAGVVRGSTAAFADGILTRGVLLDLAPGDRLPAGHAVTGDDLDAAADRAGIDVEPGDAVVVRGGWDLATRRHQALPGVSVDAVAWLHRHDVALWIGDIGDATPPVDPADPAPLHRIALARLGMPLVDVAAPDDLAAACAEEGRYHFLLVAAPPRFLGASGVPVNPLAVF